MTDFEKAEELILNFYEPEIFSPAIIENDEFGTYARIEGSIDLWDYRGQNSLRLIFNPDGSFKELFFND